MAAPIVKPKYLATSSFSANPYPCLARLRESAPAVPVEIGGFRMWAVTRYADVRRLLADPDLHKDLIQHGRTVMGQSMIRPEHRAWMARESRRSLLDRDGEDHRRLRGLMAGEFTSTRVAAMRPMVERTAAKLLDRLPQGEPIDLVAAYARPLVATVLAELAGIPADDRQPFPQWGNAMLTGESVAEVEEGARLLHEYGIRLVERKRREPGDDLYTRILRQHDVDDAMDYDELLSSYVVLLIGGSEPISTIGSGLLRVLERPGLTAELGSSTGSLAGCVEEILRFESPFRMLAPRICPRPVQLDDMEVPAGELIVTSPGAANRDPARFRDPDRFDIHRDTRGHLGFGHGPHRCVGAELGRLETEIAIHALCERFPGTRLAIPADQAAWRGGAFMRRLHGLPVILG